MKKQCLFLAAAFTAMCASADVLVSESFAYPAGNLNSQGQLVVSGTAGSNPINVIEGSLTRAGYQDEASGNSVVVDMQLGKNAVQHVFAPKGSDPVTGTVYYSALLRVDEFPSSLGSKPGSIIALTGLNATTGDFGDSMTGSEGAGLFIKKGTADGTAVFGISRNSSPNGVVSSDVTWTSAEIPVGETVLVVVGYEKTEGAEAAMNLWVNPSAEASATPDVAGAKGTESLVDIRGIELCQRSALTSKIPQVTIDELRVATTWDEIFTGSTTPVTVPNVTISENPVDFGQAYCNVTVERKVTVSGTDLEGDITLTLGESGQVSLSATTIPAEAAMADGGFELIIALTPVESRFYSEKITVSTPGAADKVLHIEWASVPSLVATSLSQLANEDSNDMTSVYVYKGQATVTFIESYYDLSYDRVVNSIFAQDATGGVELRSATGCGYQEVKIDNVKVGDNLTDIVGYLIFGNDGLTMVPRTEECWEVVSHGNEVKPLELTLRQMALADDGYVYGNQLVTIKNVVFPDKYFEAGDYYGTWNSQKYEIYDGTLDEYEALAWMWCNKGADYFKTSTEGVFDHRWNLTGICNGYYPIHISPRSKADFEDLGPKSAGIGNVAAGAEAVEEAVYDLYGRRMTGDEAVKGLRLVRMSDGTVRKTVR